VSRSKSRRRRCPGSAHRRRGATGEQRSLTALVGERQPPVRVHGQLEAVGQQVHRQGLGVVLRRRAQCPRERVEGRVPGGGASAGRHRGPSSRAGAPGLTWPGRGRGRAGGP
jgi:hypothetical protein